MSAVGGSKGRDASLPIDRAAEKAPAKKTRGHKTRRGTSSVAKKTLGKGKQKATSKSVEKRRVSQDPKTACREKIIGAVARHCPKISASELRGMHDMDLFHELSIAENIAARAPAFKDKDFDFSELNKLREIASEAETTLEISKYATPSELRKSNRSALIQAASQFGGDAVPADADRLKESELLAILRPAREQMKEALCHLNPDFKATLKTVNPRTTSLAQKIQEVKTDMVFLKNAVAETHNVEKSQLRSVNQKNLLEALESSRSDMIDEIRTSPRYGKTPGMKEMPIRDLFVLLENKRDGGDEFVANFSDDEGSEEFLGLY